MSELKRLLIPGYIAYQESVNPTRFDPALNRIPLNLLYAASELYLEATAVLCSIGIFKQEESLMLSLATYMGARVFIALIDHMILSNQG